MRSALYPGSKGTYTEDPVGTGFKETEPVEAVDPRSQGTQNEAAVHPESTGPEPSAAVDHGRKAA